MGGFGGGGGGGGEALDDGPGNDRDVGEFGSPKDANGQYVIDDQTMADILDKLRLLDYETEFLPNRKFKPLTHDYFTRPAPNPNEQLYYFHCLAAWLMGICGSHFSEPDQFADPNSTITSLIAELKALKLPVVQVQPTQLKAAHGASVLVVLTMVSDLALTSRGFTGFPEAIYAPDEYGDDDVGDDDDDDEVDDEFFHRDADSEEEEYYVGGRAAKGAVEDEKGEIKTQVDPDMWRMAVDRVAPQLKLPVSGDMRDWRSHLELITQLRKKIDKVSPDILATLTKVSDDIAKATEKIAKREAALAAQFDNSIENYRAEKRVFDDIHGSHKEIKERVDKLSAELNTLTESADGVKNEIDQRNASTTDVTPLHKIREAMQRIRGEIKTMELRIGVLQSQLMQYRVEQASQQRAGLTGTVRFDLCFISTPLNVPIHSYPYPTFPSLTSAANGRLRMRSMTHGDYDHRIAQSLPLVILEHSSDHFRSTPAFPVWPPTKPWVSFVNERNIRL